MLSAFHLVEQTVNLPHPGLRHFGHVLVGFPPHLVDLKVEILN